MFSVCFGVFFVKMFCFARSAKKIFLVCVLVCFYCVFGMCLVCVNVFSVCFS